MERLMREEGMVAREGRGCRERTDWNHPRGIARSVLERRCEVELRDGAWVSEVRCVWGCEGWLCLGVSRPVLASCRRLGRERYATAPRWALSPRVARSPLGLSPPSWGVSPAPTRRR